MKHQIFTIAAMLLLCAPLVGAQSQAPDSKYSIKANTNIGLGNAYTVSSAVNGVALDKSNDTSFGVDFRYRFWQKNSLSCGINAGLGYAVGNQTVKIDNLKFNYAAGADADMDGDTHQRFTEVTDASQKVSLDNFLIPVYVDFNWQFSQRVSLYANTGFAFRFSTTTKAKDLKGSCSAYGIYPKYDNLKMDDGWLNDFGDHSLSGASVEEPQQNSLTMSVMGGAGLRVWIYGPLSFECGLNYHYGFMNRLKSGNFADGSVTADNAPVTYTVANGRTVKSFSSAFNNNKLSILSLNFGLIFSF